MKQQGFKKRTRMLACTALIPVSMVSGQVMAQDTASQEPGVGLEEIIVTAQRREQSLQDVPIAVTALSRETLLANRVTTVNDLSGLAPGVTVRPAAGGSQIPSFSLRGVVSYGVVPGSDKQVSVYLDGVYISSPRGSIFDLPDVERIEMLRGPQGTLFGRNATAGAVSVSTRDPSGEMKIRARATVGNYDQYRFQMSVDTPEIGPFSAYLSYVHNYKRGDIANAAAGQVWDRSRSPEGLGVRVSPKFLGTKDGASYFAALKFAPSDTFKMVYKFDHYDEEGTPDGNGLIGFDAASPGIGAYLSAAIDPKFIAADGKRPKEVSNGWVVPATQRATGHSLTTTWDVADDVTIKNITAYRKTYIFAASALDGISGVTLSPIAAATYSAVFAGGSPAATAAFTGAPAVFVATNPVSQGSQWSSETQINYNSDFVTLTAGGIWFKSKDREGNPGLTTTPQFTNYPGGVIPLGQTAVTLSRANSIAAYAQGEFHLSPQLDVVLGARITRDKKSGSLNVGRVSGSIATLDELLARLLSIPYTYQKTKPNFLAGVNYKPNDDILVYGKFSTAFVSGGAVAGVPFEPETARSFEAGIKADLFDNRLRTNLSVYTVTYKNFQTAQGGTNFATYLNGVGAAAGIPGLNDGSANQIQLARVIGTFILPQGGPVKAKGFEFEATAAPVRGLTLGGSLSYTKTSYNEVNPVLLASNGPNAQGQLEYPPALRPDWTASLSAAYETQPISGDMRLSARVDANWTDEQIILSGRNTTQAFNRNVLKTPASWIVNGRLALKDINLGGVQTELAVWSRNMFDNKNFNYALNLGPITGAAYTAARTFGVDLNIEF